MTSSVVRIQRLDSIPLAVIQRQVTASEFSRVVPECCGLVWDVIRAQQAPAGRNIAIYWDDSIRLEAGMKIDGPFTEHGEVVRSATPAGAVAKATHFGPMPASARRTTLFASGALADNHRLAGPSWEVYGHWQREWNADPSQYDGRLLSPRVGNCSRTSVRLQADP